MLVSGWGGQPGGGKPGCGQPLCSPSGYWGGGYWGGGYWGGGYWGGGYWGGGYWGGGYWGGGYWGGGSSEADRPAAVGPTGEGRRRGESGAPHPGAAGGSTPFGSAEPCSVSPERAIEQRYPRPAPQRPRATELARAPIGRRGSNGGTPGHRQEQPPNSMVR